MLQVEIGARKMPKNGWTTLDHSWAPKGDRWDLMFDDFPFKDNSVDFFYLCMVMEHIPLRMAPECYQKMHRKMKVGARIRLVTPDMAAIAKAYVDGNSKWFKASKIFVDRQHRQFGVSGSFINSLISYGHDTVLTSKKDKATISGMAHVAGYDFNIMSTMLKDVGFRNVTVAKYDKGFEPKRYTGALIVEAIK